MILPKPKWQVDRRAVKERHFIMSGLSTASQAACLVSMLGLLTASCGSPSGQALGASSSPSASSPGIGASGASAAPSPTALPQGVLASIPLHAGDAPTGIAIGFGSVWVQSHRGNRLFRIDPASNTVIARIDIGQEACGELAIGFGRVWVGHCDTGTKTIVVDPTTNQVVGSFEGGGLYSATIAFGSVWTPSPSFDTLLRIDPTSYRVVASTKVAGASVVPGAGFIWVAEVSPATGDYSGIISKVDPATNQVVATLQTPKPGSYPWITFAFDALWLKSSDNGTLLRVDPASGKARTYTVPNFSPLSQFGDVFISTDSSNLWMRTSDGTVSQMDPRTGQVLATYPADRNGGGGYVAIGFGSLWVANFGSDTLWRDRITS